MSGIEVKFFRGQMSYYNFERSQEALRRESDFAMRERQRDEEYRERQQRESMAATERGMRQIELAFTVDKAIEQLFHSGPHYSNIFTFIHPPDMFAKTILRIDDPSHLCRLLTTLDQEEATAQADDEREIEKEIEKTNPKMSAAIGTVTGLWGGALGLMVTVGTALPAPIAVPVTLITGLLSGLAMAGISSQTEGIGLTRKRVEAILKIPTKRAIRLADKVRRIAAEKAAEGISSWELDQLTKTEMAFTHSVSQFRQGNPNAPQP
jgi:hypothetical protein